MAAVQASSRLGRWLAVAVLVAGLLALGVFDEPVLLAFTSAWQKLLAALGLGQYTEAVQRGLPGSVAKRFLPALATYALLYIGLCLLLLRLLLSPAQWRVAVAVYAGLLAAYVAITLVGKLAGGAPWAYRLGRHLLDFVVSPLPVAGLYVLLRYGFGPREPYSGA